MKMFLKTRLWSASAALAFVLLLPALGNAQTINGSISGAVTDQNGSAGSHRRISVDHEHLRGRIRAQRRFLCERTHPFGRQPVSWHRALHVAGQWFELAYNPTTT